jgi:glycosyltransferase involved in cell wall biosynthesis
MKIVLIKRTPFSSPDGISHFLFSLANELIIRGHDVVGITTKDPEMDRVPERFAYPNLPRMLALTQAQGHGYGFELLTWLKHGSEAIASLKPDLTIVNGAVPCSYGGHSVTVAHDAQKRSFNGIVWPRGVYKALVYRRTDRLITTCSDLVPYVSREAFFPIDKIGVIPTCVTPGLYHSRPLSERRPAIIHVGMHPYKNPMASIQSFLPLADRATLHIVGQIDPEVQRYIESLPPSQKSKIELPGIVRDDELKLLLETARVISVPSHYDAPVASPTALEAFASHTPVVTSSGVSHDFIRPGINGYLTDDSAERTRAFETLLFDDAKWESLSQGAADTTQDFNAAKIADRYLSLFQ